MGRHEAARRNLHPGQADRIAGRNGGQVVALAGIEQGVVGDRAGRDDPRHFALDQSLGQLGIFDLFADGGPEAGGDQLGQVAFQLVVGKAGHGRAVLALVARGEGQVEHAGGGLGVLVKHLVEVAHAKQQQGVGACPLGLLVLLHHGSGRRRHDPYSKGRTMAVKPPALNSNRAVEVHTKSGDSLPAAGWSHVFRGQ